MDEKPGTVHFQSPSTLEGSYRAPGSKSYTHRAFLTAATQNGGDVHHPLHSEDTDATRGVLEGFDATVSDGEQHVSIQRDGHPSLVSSELNAGESGTLFRFLLPICSLLPGPDEVVVRAEGTLRDRTHCEVIDSLRGNGLKMEYLGDEGKAPVRCFPGQSLRSREMVLKATTTSQHVSGSLIALAATGGGELRITTKLVSKPYVTMTNDVLSKAGVRVETDSLDDRLFRVRKDHDHPLDFIVPGDYSSAAFPLAGAVLTGGTVAVNGLLKESTQADRRILGILDSLGTTVEWSSEQELTLSGAGSIDGFTVDASNCPDLVPILAVMGSFAEGPVTIENIAHLANKESDRIHIPCRLLRKLGVEATARENRIEIGPAEGPYSGGTIHAHNDHRMAMAFSIFGLVNGDVTIEGAQCVAKSYPGFFADLENLGASFDRL